MMKVGLFVYCCGLAAVLSFVEAVRYECDVMPYTNVEDSLANVDYDQRYQQQEIDDFNAELDSLMEAAAGNSSCGAASLDNEDNSQFSVMVGGCENDIYEGADYSAIGGGQSNWAYTDAQMVSINGGLHNIATGDWSTIGGGVKNKAYSNYATVLGGYLGKASSKFATVAGGSRNTVSGRYSIALGMKASITSDHTLGLSFSGGDSCFVRGSNTFGVCADQFVISTASGDIDVISMLGGARRLDEISKEVSDLENENAELEAQLISKIESFLSSGRVSEADVAAMSKLLQSV